LSTLRRRLIRANALQIVVDAWGSVYSAETGIELIERLDCLPLEGRVQMTDPDVKFWIIVVDTSKALQSLPQVLRPAILQAGDGLAI